MKADKYPESNLELLRFSLELRLLLVRLFAMERATTCLVRIQETNAVASKTIEGVGGYVTLVTNAATFATAKLFADAAMRRSELVVSGNELLVFCLKLCRQIF